MEYDCVIADRLGKSSDCWRFFMPIELFSFYSLEGVLKMKTDLQIAQECVMEPIIKVAKNFWDK